MPRADLAASRFECFCDDEEDDDMPSIVDKLAFTAGPVRLVCRVVIFVYAPSNSALPRPSTDAMRVFLVR